MWRSFAIAAVVAFNTAQAPVDAPILESFIEGNGPTVVMLAGGPYGATGFETHAKTLAPDFKVVRLQTLIADRAHKKGTLPDGYSLDSETAAVARTLDALGITGPVHVIGEAFGAMIALDFALDHPQRVRTVTMFEPPAFWVMPDAAITSEPGLAAALAVTRELAPGADATNDQVAAFMCVMGTCGAELPDEGSTELKNWDALRASLRGFSAVATHRDSVDRLRTFTKPVLLVAGSETVDFHRRINDRLAAALPRIEQASITGGHTALATSRDEFVDKWRAFIGKSRAP
jgi:pimeloyl-ACP methyl ester carboxylesterase